MAEPADWMPRVTLLESLLDAIIRLDGDALVMHVGEKPYVVTNSNRLSPFRGPIAWGQVELSSRALTADSILAMLGQMLGHELCRQLYEDGTVEHMIARTGPAGERFVVTAARAGDDVCVEVRRRLTPERIPAPLEAAPEAALQDPHPTAGAGTVPDLVTALELEIPPPLPAVPVVVAGESRPPEETEMLLELLSAIADGGEGQVQPQPTATVIPMPSPVRITAPAGELTLVSLLRTATARGASTAYAVAGSRPMIRLHGELTHLTAEPIVPGDEVTRFVLEFGPPSPAASPDWSCQVPGVGRVRVVPFEDRFGAGLILHLPQPAERVDVSLDPRLAGLAELTEGLVLVAGPRGSGKAALLAAFVDLINQTRNLYVIAIETQIGRVHEAHRSFISQRQVPDDGQAIASAASAALREEPDVLAIADLRAPEAITVALDAARAGRLVFGAIAAASASDAVTRIVGSFQRIVSRRFGRCSPDRFVRSLVRSCSIVDRPAAFRHASCSSPRPPLKRSLPAVRSRTCRWRWKRPPRPACSR